MFSKLIRPTEYDIKIFPVSNELYRLIYCEKFNKLDKEHCKAFENTKQALPQIHTCLQKTGFEYDINFDSDSLTLEFILTAPFENIANAMAMEFLGYGTLGKMTLLNILTHLVNTKIIEGKNE